MSYWAPLGATLGLERARGDNEEEGRRHRSPESLWGGTKLRSRARYGVGKCKKRKRWERAAWRGPQLGQRLDKTRLYTRKREESNEEGGCKGPLLEMG